MFTNMQLQWLIIFSIFCLGVVHRVCGAEIEMRVVGGVVYVGIRLKVVWGEVPYTLIQVLGMADIWIGDPGNCRP